MPEFRKLITALAAGALFAGLASAQVGTPTMGGSTGAPFGCSVTNGAVTPTLRAEGFTELAGDIVLVCTGGVPAQMGSTVPTANITVFVNTTVTSRLLSNTTTNGATPSEALLIINEPGSTLAGYGPNLPQVVCGNSSVGAGAGGCSQSVGSTTIGGTVYQGVPVASSGTVSNAGTGTVAANVFQGITSGNQVVFSGIPVLAPATSGDSLVLRITNIRVNANTYASATGAVPANIQASISVNSSTSLTLTSSQLTIGFVQQGLSASSTARNSGNTGGGNPTLNQCSSQSITGTSGTSGALGVLQFIENFDTAFKVRGTATQNVPGTIYNSESGFTVAGVNNAVSGTNSAETAGLADYGTRLKATFNNIPAGVSLYVTTRDVTNDFVAPPATTQAQLVLAETAIDINGVIPAASQTTTYGPVGTLALSPVALNPSTNSGIAVWEIIATNPNAIDTVNFGLYISYSANAAANSPAPGTMSVTLSYAPTPSGGAFTASTGSASSASLTIPRFSDSLDITKSIGTIVLCSTSLLYPYVINISGFDTGIAVANTTTDPYGTSAQQGICSMYFYGTNGPTTNPVVMPTAATGNVVASGTVASTLASTVAPGFAGYMIMNCNFQDAHGFAFVSDVGARNLAMGYLALITARSGTSPESLNN